MEPISTELGTKHPCVKGTNKDHKDHSALKKEIMSFFSLNQCNDIIIAICKYVYCLELFLRWVIWPMGLLFIVGMFNLFRIFFAFTVSLLMCTVFQNGVEKIGNLHILGVETFSGFMVCVMKLFQYISHICIQSKWETNSGEFSKVGMYEHSDI